MNIEVKSCYGNLGCYNIILLKLVYRCVIIPQQTKPHNKINLNTILRQCN